MYCFDVVLNCMQIVGFLHFPLSFKYSEITKEFRRHGNHIIEVGNKRMYWTVCQSYSLSSCMFLVDCFMLLVKIMSLLFILNFIVSWVIMVLVRYEVCYWLTFFHYQLEREWHWAPSMISGSDYSCMRLNIIFFLQRLVWISSINVCSAIVE